MDNELDSCIVPTKDHLNVLKDKFHHDTFKPEQWRAISQIMYEKQDIFISANSNYGKSLIYQYPPVFLGKKSIVISPLISLMETQVQKLELQGISACSVGGQQRNLNINVKDYTVIYTTPENFIGLCNTTQAQGNENEICLIAVDEAHCLSKTSADHRPAYSVARNIRKAFPCTPIVALTSTASKDTTESICSILDLKNPLMLKTALNRPNIQYISTTQSESFIMDVKRYFLDMPPGQAAIIFVFKRTETETYSDALTRDGFECKPYHSGLVDEIRRETLKDFMSGRLNFLVTTNAFGMGVDRRDVRVVIHYGVPKNPEIYYMESGRAGHDGHQSKSIIFWSDKDYKFHNYCFKDNHKRKIVSHEKFAHCQKLLLKMKEYTVTPKCRRVTLLTYLDEAIPSMITETCCDNCLQTLHTKVGLHKIYREINADGVIDVTKEVRTVLSLINGYQGKCRQDHLVDFITGAVLPSGSFNPNHPVEYFACGIDKPRSWWTNIMKFIKEKRYIEKNIVAINTNNLIQIFAGIARDDCIRTTKSGLKFIRSRTATACVFPRAEYLHSLTKTDTEYFIVDEDVKARPRHGKSADSTADDTKSFDFSAFTTHLNGKSSPKKRLASESEISDISIHELFKSNGNVDDDGPPRSPKMPKLDGDANNNNDSGVQPGCSHWSGEKDVESTLKMKSCTVKVPLNREVNGKFEACGQEKK